MINKKVSALFSKYKKIQPSKISDCSRSICELSQYTHRKLFFIINSMGAGLQNLHEMSDPFISDFKVVEV